MLPVCSNSYGNVEFELEETLGATTVYIVYMPAKLVLDATKLNVWLKKFPRKGLAKMANNVYLGLMEELKPMFLTVQVVRGGFKVNKPPIYAPAYDPACFGVKG